LGKTVKISNPIYSQLDSIIDGEAQRLYKAEPWMVAYIKERAKIEHDMQEAGKHAV